MINRTLLTNGNIQFETFDVPSLRPYVGELYEVPMSASGWVVGRYEVITVANMTDGMVKAEAKRVN